MPDLIKIPAAIVLLAIVVNYFIIPKLTPQYLVHNEGYVLITGASTGIGNHAAIDIATKTNLTVLAGVRKEKDIGIIKKLNIKNLQPIIIDVTSHESNLHAVAEIKNLMEENHLPFVALINNAGISRSIPVEFHHLEDVRLLFETNFFGLLDLTQLLLPSLRFSKGRIIQISSVAGLVTPTMSGLYSSSKKALEALSDGLRREIYDQGISVSVVNPGYVKTPIFESGLKNSETAMESYSADIKQVYGKLLEKRISKREKEFNGAVGPEHSSKAIMDALKNPKPLTRYACAYALGMPAWFIAHLVRLVPDRVIDYLFAVL